MALTILTKPATLILAKQPVFFSLHSSETETPLRIIGSISGIGGDSVQADASKNASFDFSDYLKNLVTQKGKTGSQPQAYSEVPKTVPFLFAEMVGNPPENRPPLELESFLLLDGYIPKSIRKHFYFHYANVLAYLKESKACLTWWPVDEEKKVLPSQMECLNYLQVFSLNPIDITLNLSLVFRDGTQSNRGAVFTAPNVPYLKMVYFPTGYSQLGIEALAAQYPEKVLSGYIVSINYGPPNHSEPISGYYRYSVDFSYYEKPRILVFTNPFGLYEYLLCTGANQQDNTIKYETAVTNGSYVPDKLNWKTTRSDIVKTNTGFLKAKQILWLADLLESTETFELIDGAMHPIVFKDVELPVVHTGDFIYCAELEYEYAYNEYVEQA
jgi:hypothetical protein